MKGWHFLKENKKLGYGDNRVVQAGKTCRVPKDRPLVLCSYGVHASKRIIDALQYAPGPIICRVELKGEILHDSDKSVAYERHVIGMIDGADILHKFGRLCALDVIHLWKAPEIVIRYLKTGNKSIRAAAEDAAWAAVWVAARDAARATARDAARDAAWATAWVAARDAAWAAARATARDAAWDAARDKQKGRLTAMV